MCGISGLVTKSNYSLIKPDSILFKMMDNIRHRGPDDEGCVFINRHRATWKAFASEKSPWSVQKMLGAATNASYWVERNCPDLAMSHCRFAIIRPTPEGHQPFWDSNHQICMVFNGELYNYVELRKELEAAGCVFKTKTDTEVLVEAYRVWGVACFKQFNGMWALAIYDFKRRELLLSRDRTGERPLYWVRRPDMICFASEIKALLSDQTVYRSSDVNTDAAYAFLCQSVSDFDDNTFFQGIQRVPPASIVRISLANTVSIERFWQAPVMRLETLDTQRIPVLCEELRELLKSAVKLRLRADVPLNLALSGGLDSSSIVAVASELLGPGVDT
ncbi:MAG: hypothetical protein ETSY2_36760 [Candidatus Entotheonella gemina]|uniref:asparagine synthase (glutamine-hydrolyzing) n=1 Tax=Candidatus Entotheonella gemina TaxID=1429439 RepID=W4LVA3_9BACT|nr:MAG: hypothetical protein ETSY2_36760 [Candidatus Entotheonella gemina]